GYQGRAEQTAERFVANPFKPGERLYRTGDRVKLLGDGSLEFLGRVDDQVKIRGYRVELGEVVQALRAQAEVGEAEVIARDGEDGRSGLYGYVVARTGERIDAEVLRERLGKVLPDYMVPSAIVVLEALPLNANGKVDRKALPEPELTSECAYEAPQGVVEEALAAIWAEVLGVERVGRQDNFFALGGDSILSLKVVARARKRGLALVPKSIFERQTLAALAATVAVEAATPAVVIPVLEAVRKAEPLPLSYAQGRQWFLWQLEPGSTAYHIAGALRLKGRLDVQALRASFEALVARHEALRTVFRTTADGGGEQVIREHAEIGIALVDLGGIAAGERETRLAEEVRRLQGEPFDLTNGPLLRVGLIREGTDAHVLVVAMHHIVSDGWSMQVIVDEFVAQYRARLQGGEASLPPLPIQYADYALWQRNWLEAGEKDRQLEYWKAQLGEMHPVLQLPTDRPRRADGQYRAARHRLELPAEL
ncbi:condensation domain-containing protein, partial [Azotobacter armeniacus]